MEIDPDLFHSFLKCPTKCWLRATHEPEPGNNYAEWVKTQDKIYRGAETERLVIAVPNGEVVVSPAEQNLKSVKWRLTTSLRVQSQLDSCTVESEVHAVERVPSAGQGKPSQFIPIRFVFTNKPGKDHNLLLAFDAFVLSKSLGREVKVGRMVHGDKHASLKVKTSALAGEVRKHIEKIATLLASPSPPDLVLNRHCAECEFQARCRKIAVEKDDLSLLSGMSEKERLKFRSKGIFTVTQLSYTFRARRRSKRWKSLQPTYSHALKALAIREKKVHVIGSQKIELTDTPVYLDVEGTDDGFYYLVGTRTASQQHSFWADEKSQERTVVKALFEFLAVIPKPRLVYYGRYELHFLDTMHQRYPDLFQYFPGMERLVKESLNLVTALYAKVYFPTFSNTLKDLAQAIGFSWKFAGTSGLRALAWRSEWELTKANELKETLIRYNADDCEALELVATFASNLYQSSDLSTPSCDCVRVEELKPLVSHFLINKGQGALPEFKQINQAAYWDYQRLHVYARTNKVIKKASKPRKMAMKQHIVRKHFVHAPAVKCPYCGDTGLQPYSGGSQLVHDIKFVLNGVKAWVTQHRYSRSYCSRCQRMVDSPTEHPFSLCKYGLQLRAYAVDQLIRLNIPGATIAKSLGDLFHYELTGEHLCQFKASFAELYKDSVADFTARMVKGPLIHADETAARVVGKSAVVWVLASMEEVAFLYAESREGTMVRDILGGFNGVLVSDFYAVYDAFDCPQQKCLIHLIRDLNDDMHRYPFDMELRQIASEFTGVLKPIIETVDQRGLKAYFLARHLTSVQRFLAWATSRDFQSETAKGYAQRFRKNRDKLFTFMSNDGVPWNNNNAENAIRAFAALRERIGGHCTEKSLRHYLTLLSISETCKRRGLCFFDFLCSGDKSLENFIAHRTSPRSKKRTVHTYKTQDDPEPKVDIRPIQRVERSMPIVQEFSTTGCVLASPWEHFRPCRKDNTALSSEYCVKLDRFDDVPFGRVVLAIPALMECGLWEHSLDLFPEWIDGPFAESGMFLIASMFLMQSEKVDVINRAWPAGWNELLCSGRLPDNRSLVHLANLIGKNPLEVFKWQASLSDKWISRRAHVKAIVEACGQSDILLDAPVISSACEEARKVLLVHEMVEIWFRVLDGAPVLLLSQRSSEDIRPFWKEWILPQIQRVAQACMGKSTTNTARESRKLTVVFVNGGIDFRHFRKLQKEGLHVLSYQYSTDDPWSDVTFVKEEVEVKAGHRESVLIAERELNGGDGLPLRAVRCICQNVPELTVISSNRELNLHRIAAKMAFEFTASRFLECVHGNLALVRSLNTQKAATHTVDSKVAPGLESFVNAISMVLFRTAVITEQILREKLPQSLESPSMLPDILHGRIDLVPALGANILRVIVHVKGDFGEQAAVANLCRQLTATETRFPGSNLRLVYEPLADPRPA